MYELCAGGCGDSAKEVKTPLLQVDYSPAGRGQGKRESECNGLTAGEQKRADAGTKLGQFVEGFPTQAISILRQSYENRVGKGCSR